MEQLRFFGGQKVPLLLQAEASECGLACLAMIASFHGYRTSMNQVRQRYGASSQGVTLHQLIELSQQMHLLARPLKLDLKGLKHLRLPALLHWDFNHFVVLVSVSEKRVVVHDPAKGQLQLTPHQVAKHFTGVALELTPSTEFKTQKTAPKLSLKRLLGHLPGIKGSISQILALALILELLLLLMPWLTQWVIDDVVITGDKQLLLVLVGGFLLLIGFRATAELVRSWLLLILGSTVNLQLLSNLFGKMMALPFGFFERRHLGDVVSRFESINVIQRTLTTGFLEAVIDGLMAICTLIMLFFYSIKLALIVILAALGYFLLRMILFAPMKLATEDKISCSAKQHSNLLETIRGIQTLKLFNQEAQRQGQYQNLTVNHFNADIRLQKIQIYYRLANSLIFSIENVLVVALGALLIINQQFTVGMLFAFMAYKDQFSRRAIAFIEKMIELRMLGLHTERVGDIALTASETSSDDSPLALSQLEHFNLELDNLGFSYQKNTPPLIRQLSATITAGESVAIVGASGCGKSTLVKLLLGLLIPDQGKILVGGVAASTFGLKRYRQLFGAVLQDDQLFAGSVLENICCFATQPDRQWAEQCAAMASIHQDIRQLPMGYNSLIGDMGGALSGGQKQRLLLARALYKRPRILVLDEATSHLDVAAEKQVNAAIKQLDITRIIIAHRPETIASADRILVLQNGQLIPEQDKPTSQQRMVSMLSGMEAH